MLPPVKVDIRPLKKFAIEQLPKDSSLYHILLSEKDTMDIDEFICKVEIYLKLASNLKT
jgi:hypothetical protein